MVSVKAHSVCICPPAISFEFGWFHWRADMVKEGWTANTHTHNHFTAIFPGLPAWAGARRNLLDFMVQGKITEADTPTIRMGATPSELIIDPPPSPPFPPIFTSDALLLQPSQFILAWDRHRNMLDCILSGVVKDELQWVICLVGVRNGTWLHKKILYLSSARVRGSWLTEAITPMCVCARTGCCI